MLFLSTEPASIVEWATARRAASDLVMLLGTYRDRVALAESLVALEAAGITAFGGWFERVIHGTKTYDQGCVATTFRASHPPSVVPGTEAAYRDLERLTPAPNVGLNQTVVVFADPDLPNLASFFRRLYTRYGNSVEYLGAGTGVKANRVQLTAPEMGSLFTAASGMVSDSVVVALVDHKAGVAAKHGWTRAGRAMIASEVDEQGIREINWRPAWDVYLEAVEAAIGAPLPADKSRRYGVVGYPLGMKRAGGEDLLRLPLDVDASGGLRCVGGVPSNAVLHLLQGVPENLFAAAQDAARASLEALAQPAHQTLLVECVTRAEYLDQRFVEELQAIDDVVRANCANTGIGVLSRGELSSIDGGYPEMLNKTAVVGAFQP